MTGIHDPPAQSTLPRPPPGPPAGSNGCGPGCTRRACVGRAGPRRGGAVPEASVLPESRPKCPLIGVHHAPCGGRTAGCARAPWTQLIMKTGWLAATAAHSASVESGPRPSKNMPDLELPARRYARSTGTGRPPASRGRAELAPAPEDQDQVAVGVAHVAHPLRVAPGATRYCPFQREGVDRGAVQLAGGPAPVLEPREPQTLTPRRVRPLTTLLKTSRVNQSGPCSAGGGLPAGACWRWWSSGPPRWWPHEH